MAINSVSLSGNLARDPEIRTSGATIVCNFRIVVDDNVKNRDTGQWERVPNFFDVVVFGKYGDAVAQRLYKGAKVFVDGKLHYSTWQAQDGSKRSRVSVYASTVETASQANAQNAPQGAFTPQNVQTYQQSYNAAPQQATASSASMQAQPSVPPMPQTPPSTPQVPQAPQVPPAPQQQAARPAVSTSPFEANPFEQTLSASEMLEMAADDLPF